MKTSEALGIAQEAAHDMLMREYDTVRNIPLRNPEYADLWGGDRWAEAYIAAGEPQRASTVLNTLQRSIRPDGSVPHMLQGRRMWGPFDVRPYVDGTFFRIDAMLHKPGIGLQKLQNGEHVTKLYAPPTWALGALAVHTALPDKATPLTLVDAIDATEALYYARGNKNDLIEARHIDELTRNGGPYRQDIHDKGAAVDPAINALLVLNNRALQAYASAVGAPTAPSHIRERMRNTEIALTAQLQEAHSAGRTALPEETLAAARIGLGDSVHDRSLYSIFEAPDPDSKALHATHLSLPECIEVARLTADNPLSKTYLERIVRAVAHDPTNMTRFEGVKPGMNGVVNKIGRKHDWLLTAAEIVQIPPSALR